MDEILVYTVDEFTKAVGIKRGLLFKLWREGHGPPRIKIGRRVVIPKEAGKHWLADQMVSIPLAKPPAAVPIAPTGMMATDGHIHSPSNVSPRAQAHGRRR
jgi:predicted DNA-binding transcriptional regulator AlpA